MNKNEEDTIQKKKIRISAILLAAGNSTRFGSENKLLWHYGQKPMYQYAMELFSNWKKEEDQEDEICVKDLICVSQYDTLLKAAVQNRMKPVKNKKSDLGISYSIQLGIEACKETDAFLFFVCDQPNLKVETLKKMSRRAVDLSKKGLIWIVCAGKEGQPRNPAIFSAFFKKELQNLSGDIGGKQLIRKYHQYVWVCEAAEEQELIDFDQKSSFFES